MSAGWSAGAAVMVSRRSPSRSRRRPDTSSTPSITLMSCVRSVAEPSKAIDTRFVSALTSAQ
jgi:hypothetical protein